MYLRCLAEGKPIINFVLGKSKLVLTHQINWVISRKELETAKLCCALTLLAKQALRDRDYTLHFGTDSQVVLGWITNPELNLARFVKRRMDKILHMSSSAAWKYIHTSQNPADVGTRGTAFRKPEFVKLWLGNPEFLAQRYVDVVALVCAPVVCMTLLEEKSRENCENGLVKIIESANNLYALKKRFAYLLAFIEYLVAKSRKALFVRPALDATYMDRALVKAVEYV